MNTPAPEAARLHPIPARRLALWAAVAAAFAAGVVVYSQQAGPLVLGPSADAAGYFVDAINQVRLLYDRGVAHWLITQLGDASQSPRSPYARWLAMAAFLLFGFRDWAPFLANGVVVFALLCGVDALLGPVRSLTRLGIITLVLTVPLVAHAVLEFIPDFACGIATAFAILATQILRPLGPPRRCWRRGLLLGLLWVVPMLCKPNVIPVTGLLLLASVALAAASAATLERPRVAWRGVAVWFVAGVVTVLLLAGPYFLVRGSWIYGYVQTNIFDERAELWKYRGAWWEHAVYFIAGPSGWRMLGPQLWLVLSLLLTGLIALLWKGSREARLLHARIAIMVLGAYLIPTLNEVKTPWFGLTFQVLIVLWSALAVAGCQTQIVHQEAPIDRRTRDAEGGGEAWSVEREGSRASGSTVGRAVGRPSRWGAVMTALVVLAAVMAVLLVRPDPRAAAGSSRAAAEVRLRDAVWVHLRGAVLQHAVDHEGGGEGGGPLRVVMLSNGPVVNRGAFRYAAVKEGLLRDLDIDYAHTWTLADFRRAMRRADVVVASEAGNGMVYARKPASLIQNQTLAAARRDPDLIETARLPAMRGKAFYIFVRRRSPEPPGPRALQEEDGETTPTMPRAGEDHQNGRLDH